MPTRSITGVDIEVDDRGYLKHAGEWTQRMAPILAREAGIKKLTPEHWHVLDCVRDQYLKSGRVPTVGQLRAASGFPIGDLNQLFPKAPAEVAAKVAGVPRPRRSSAQAATTSIVREVSA